MPKNKKLESSSDDSDSGPEDRNPVKKSKTDPPSTTKAPESKSKSSSSSKSDDTGDGKTWILEKMRMVKISEFRGRQMVDIREHYEANGEIRPGKKGICLSVSQWKKLCSVMDEINQNLE